MSVGTTALIGAGIGAAGGIMSGLSTKKQTSTSTNTSINDNTNTTTPNEPTYMSNFRQGLIPGYNNLMAQAQKPVYGDAQRAQYLNNVNSLGNSATSSLANTLASHGGSLNSGAFGAGATNIAMNRLGAMSQYDTMAPAANQQAMMQNQANVLGLGMNFAGRAPVGQTTTSNGTNVSTQQGTQTQPGSWGQVMGNIGGMMGGMGGQMFTQGLDQTMGNSGGGGGGGLASFASFI